MLVKYMEMSVIDIEVPEGCNIILGMAHFIKTVEDIYETLVTSFTNLKFGLAFCESSGPCLVRYEEPITIGRATRSAMRLPWDVGTNS